MLNKINDFLTGLPMTLIGACFLVCSLLMPRLGVQLPLDPAWATIVICGIPLLYLAIWRIIHNPGVSKISSALLISMAMLAAIIIGDVFAAGEVAFIMAIGAILEDMTTRKARKGLKRLINLAPLQGRRINADKEEMIPAEAIRPGDVLRVLPGETIPADGIIICGTTSVDQSIMTGESLPVDKEVGAEVFGGTINCFGAVDIQATKVGADSSLQKLIHMVQEADNNQAPMQRIADKWASWLVPIALLIAIITGLITGNIVRAVTVLVVICPCALVLATPTAIMAAIGQATKHGVIIKSGEALEKMAEVDTIAFDKTGTLTYGRLEVCEVKPFEAAVSENELLALAAAAEARSEHPLGRAIMAYAAQMDTPVIEASLYQMNTGQGVYAEVAGHKLLCGNENFLRENEVALDGQTQQLMAEWRLKGRAAVLIADNKRCIGAIALADVLRPEPDKLIGRLLALQTKTVLLTGDNPQTAAYFADKVGIEEVYAGLLPAEKVRAIEKLQAGRRRVCMIGDGVNDAPALKTADVGVAMANVGSDIAIDAADIALMTDDINKLSYLKRLANATVGTIKFSIALSMCINFIAVVLSVHGVLSPTTGALVHNAGSCFVVLLAALLYDRKFE